MSYDSRVDTLKHIEQVRQNLNQVINDLTLRAGKHDQSKLEDPEKAVFDKFTPKLAETTYGSDEYKEQMKGMAVGLKHHYAMNDHHPEHFWDGIKDMSLIQLIEMLADWKAATMRHEDGDLLESLAINQKRFGFSDDILKILHTTARDMGWL